MAVINSKSFTIVLREKMKNPPQFEFEEIRPGQFRKKLRQVVKKSENKMLLPVDSKSDEQISDDFTQIKGVGPATSRSLVAHGITTFDRLKVANIDFLPSNAKDAVNQWRESNGE